MAKQGDEILVRTYGGYPRVRRLWEATGDGCVVVEDQYYARMMCGDLRFAVGLPIEDVFEFSPGLKFDPRRPFSDWHMLRHLSV